MPLSPIVRVMTTGVSAIGAAWFLVAVPSAAQPSTGTYPDAPPPNCTGNAFTGRYLVPVPGDPTAYYVCAGGLNQGIERCPSGNTFNATAGMCIPEDTAVVIPTLTVDGISENTGTIETGPIIHVNVTYSAPPISQASIIDVHLSDPANQYLPSVDGETSLVGVNPDGSPIQLDLISDGQPQSIDIPVRATPDFGPPPLYFQEGENIRVQATLYNAGKPIQVTRTLAAPAPVA
jgi:Chitin binding Peritrophin-A domain